MCVQTQPKNETFCPTQPCFWECHGNRIRPRNRGVPYLGGVRHSGLVWPDLCSSQTEDGRHLLPALWPSPAPGPLGLGGGCRQPQGWRDSSAFWKWIPLFSQVPWSLTVELFGGEMVSCEEKGGNAFLHDFLQRAKCQWGFCWSP